jgi:hypothetical protein
MSFKILPGQHLITTLHMPQCISGRGSYIIYDFVVSHITHWLSAGVIRRSNSMSYLERLFCVTSSACAFGFLLIVQFEYAFSACMGCPTMCPRYVHHPCLLMSVGQSVDSISSSHQRLINCLTLMCACPSCHCKISASSPDQDPRSCRHGR